MPRAAAFLLCIGCTANGGAGRDAAPADAGACGAEGEGPEATCRAPVGATVSRVIDGDTIEVDVDGGGDESVRFLGIDTPESDEGTCGSAAETWLRAWIPVGARVTLSFDTECEDSFGRTLAYVRDADGALVNALLVGAGQAQACPYEPNTAYADWLACLESEARDADVGSWADGCHLDDCFE